MQQLFKMIHLLWIVLENIGDYLETFLRKQEIVLNTSFFAFLLLQKYRILFKNNITLTRF